MWWSTIISRFSSTQENNDNEEFQGHAPGHFILDPDSADIVTSNDPTWRPVSVRPEVRDTFGCIPNEALLLPGDLLLVCPKTPTIKSKAICRVQLDGGYHRSHACWHHVAIYLGGREGLLCEAVRDVGVRVDSLYRYVPDYWLRFRRDPTMTDDQRLILIVTVLRRLGEPYDVKAAYKLFVQSRDRKYGFWHRNYRDQAGHAVICSQIYRDAYLYTMNKLPVERNLNVILPADLSATHLLQDVQVNWVRAVKAL